MACSAGLSPGVWGSRRFVSGSPASSLFRADRGREMGQRVFINAKKKFCSNDVIPQYERYYRRVLESSSAARA